MKCNHKVIGAVLASVWLTGCSGAKNTDNNEHLSIADNIPVASQYCIGFA